MGRRRSKSGTTTLATMPAPPQVRAKFDLAQTTPENRRHWTNADGLAARAAMSPAVRRVVRIRSRYESENNSWYAGILRTAVNHIVGSGPRLQVLTADSAANQRLELAWRRWVARVDFADMLRTIVEAYWRDGEVFVMRADRPQWYPLALDLRTIEADQVSMPWQQSQLQDPFVDDGIRFDPSLNELEFYVYDHHPGTNAPVSLLNGDWYPASEVLHLYRAERPGQTRGIPRATPALQTLPIMRRQELATLYSAETAANFAMYLKATGPAVQPAASGADFAEIELTRNMLTTLPEGWEIGQVEPKQPGPLYEMFQRQALMSFCRCTNMPYTLAAGTGKDANFSSFKGDMANVWAPEVNVERDRITWAIVERVWHWFLESAVFAPGLLSGMPRIEEIDHQWTWPPLPELDATEAASAAAMRLSTGQSTLSEEHARRGKEWEMEATRAAADFGVSVEEYKRAVFNKTFGIDPAVMQVAQQAQQPTAPAQASGEYTTIGQRAFSNNQKRIRRALDELQQGTASRAFTEQTLASIGLSAERIAVLVDDALEDGLSDDELSQVEAAVDLRAAGKYDDIDFTPPEGVRSEAQKGLNWRSEYGRGGTAVGIARARDLSNGKAMSPDTIGRMVSYFARHEVDKKGEGWSPGEPGFPSNGRIAWALWGGDAGAAWAGKVSKQMDARDEE
jgi:lambda family phage portal protein